MKSERREYLLFAAALTVSLLIAAAVLRVLEPRLFSRPADMEVVQLDKKIPAFFEGVFDAAVLKEASFLVHDPITGVRGKPLLPPIEGVGPHDVLGFRNRSLPRIADVVTIGDSQTYGNNALREQSWPGVLQDALKAERVRVYNMSVGSWGAPQYVYMARKALLLKPQVVVVALYTGNDLLESFTTVFHNPYWELFRDGRSASQFSPPEISFPPDEELFLTVPLNDVEEVVFTPARRLAALDIDNDAVAAGFEIVTRVIAETAELAASSQSTFVVTVIPTKEFAFAKKLEDAEMEGAAEYQALVAKEGAVIERIRAWIAKYDSLLYVDTASALQQAVLHEQAVYPNGPDGHPLPRGYRVIGEKVAAAVAPYTKRLEDGVYYVDLQDGREWMYQVQGGKAWRVTPEEAGSVRGQKVTFWEIERVL